MIRGLQQMLSTYERALTTRHEVVSWLLKLAADTPPAVIAADLPGDWLIDLRQDCEHYLPCPPAGRMVFVRSVCAGPGYDAEQVRRDDEERWRAGLSAWQAFFGLEAGRPA